MIPALKFSEIDWERHAQNWNVWWAGELERPLVILESPPRKRLPEELTNEFLLHKPVAQVLDFYQARLEKTYLFGDAWPKWFPFFGAGVMAAFLGADLLCKPDEATIWFEPSQPFASYDLSPLYDPENLWWRRVCDLTQAALDRWRGGVSIGFTDLGGNLDILASLRGSQALLMDMYDCPEQVEAACRQITQFWLHYYAELWGMIQKTGRGNTPWAPLWGSGTCYMLQSDFSAMISPKMFERFVLPDLIACCDALDFPFYHLDGKGQLPHLELLLSIEKLRGIQWIPGDGQPPPEAWLPVLKRIRATGKLCQLFVTAAGALEIAHQLGGKGFAFYITNALDDMAAQAFLDEINSVP